MFIGQLPPGTTRDEVWEALLTFGGVHTECGDSMGKKLVPSIYISR